MDPVSVLRIELLFDTTQNDILIPHMKITSESSELYEVPLMMLLHLKFCVLPIK